MNYNEVDIIYSKLLNINKIMEDNLSNIAKKFNLNVTELKILIDLKANPDSDLNALCKRLGIKKSTASKAVIKLINENKISKCTDVVDQRKIALNYLVNEEIDLCKESILINTFKVNNQKDINFDSIEKSLNDVIDLLKNK